MSIIIKHKKGYAAFDNAQQGDITFIAERDPWKAYKMIEKCNADKIYICKSVYEKFFGDKLYETDWHERLIPVCNPRLEFIKELSNDDQFLSTYAMTNREPKARDIKEVRAGRGYNTTVVYTRLGDNCMMGSNTTIGSTALSTERDEDGRIYRFPHIGYVDIGNSVWIGSNVNISRGVLLDTIIWDSVTIDDHVHIAHNCVIGERTQIAAGAVLGGSVEMGRDCWIGLGAVIDDHVKIGNHVIVGAGSHVRKDIPDEDIVAGNPALSIKEKATIPPWKRYQMVGLR